VAITTRVFSAMTGRPPVDPPEPLRIGVVKPQINDARIRPGVAAALASALERVSLVFTLTDVDGSALTEIGGTFDDILLWEAWQVHRDQVTAHPEHYGRQTLRLLRAASAVTHDAYAAALRRRDDLLPAVAEAFSDVDVVLTPAAPFTAPVTTPPVDTPEGALEGLFTSPFNLTGDPAVVLPCGRDSGGLPVGLQVSAPRNADLRLLAAASLIEQALAL